MNRSFLAFLTLAWAFALLSCSLLPLSIKISLHTTADHRILHPMVHMVSFALLALPLAAMAKVIRESVLALIAVTSFGAIIEILEARIYHQPLELSDIVIDSVGALTGLLLCHLVRNKTCTIRVDKGF